MDKIHDFSAGPDDDDLLSDEALEELFYQEMVEWAKAIEQIAEKVPGFDEEEADFLEQRIIAEMNRIEEEENL